MPQVGPPNLELSRVSSPLVPSHTAWLLWTPTSADAGRARQSRIFYVHKSSRSEDRLVSPVLGMHLRPLR